VDYCVETHYPKVNPLDNVCGDCDCLIARTPLIILYKWGLVDF